MQVGPTSAGELWGRSRLGKTAVSSERTVRESGVVKPPQRAGFVKELDIGGEMIRRLDDPPSIVDDKPCSRLINDRTQS